MVLKYIKHNTCDQTQATKNLNIITIHISRNRANEWRFIRFSSASARLNRSSPMTYTHTRTREEELGVSSYRAYYHNNERHEEIVT